MKLIFTPFLSLIFFSLSLAQERKIQLLSEIDQAVVNAHLKIFNEHDSVYGISSIDGEFRFSDLSFPLSIEISHLSYHSQKIRFNKPFEELTIVLKANKRQLNEVVITGQARAILAKDATQKIKVIGREKIEALAAVNLSDLLINELNIQVSEDAVLGSQIRLAGLGGQKVKILIDGVPVIGRLDGNIDLSQINLNNIERVEIVEGPMSVQYGTDAIAGTINLISKKHQNQNSNYQLNSFVESIGRYNLDVNAKVPLKKSQFNLGLGRNFFKGFDFEDKRDQQWNPKEQYFGQLAWKTNWKKTIFAFSSNFFDEKISNKGDVGSIDSLVVPLEDTSGAFKYPRALDDYYYTKRIDNQIRIQHFFKDDEVLKFHLAYNFFQRAKVSELINLSSLESTKFSGLDAQDTSRFATLNSRAFYENSINSWQLNYQFGYELNHETSKGERIVKGQQELLDLGFFTSLNFKIHDNFNIQPGFRYSYNSKFQNPLISSLALKYNKGDHWIFRASYGRGFRAPSLKELYFFFVDENHNILGNADLKAETSHNFQANVDFEKQYSKFLFNLNSSIFYNKIENEIKLISVLEADNSDPRGLYTNRNVAQSRSAGFNLMAKFILANWKIESGFSLTGLKNDLSFSDEAGQEENRDFLFFPQYRLNLSYTLPKIGVQSSLFLSHTGSREDLILDGEGEIQRIRFQGFTQSNFNISKSFFKKKLKLSMGVKNLFNITQIQSNIQLSNGSHSGGSGSMALSYGRSYFIRMQLSF
tara:strand:- start:182196 stop:184472 length:2277 start_codon:yes stop_codon:yes gene_type:complete